MNLLIIAAIVFEFWVIKYFISIYPAFLNQGSPKDDDKLTRIVYIIVVIFWPIAVLIVIGRDLVKAVMQHKE